MIKVTLKKRIEKKKVEIKDLEAQIAASKCGFWDALLTVGISCIIKGNAKAELETVKANFNRELAASNKLMTRMFYFDGLVKTAKHLTLEATGLLETTKKFENRLADTKLELE